MRKRNEPKFNLAGQRFGRLLVIEYVGASKWRCVCDCGKETRSDGRWLRCGDSSSCGCYHRDAVTKHGGHNAHEYRAWQSARIRCSSPKHKSYRRYGGRGIVMHREWADDFHAFLRHIGPRPSNKHTLDRKDNSKGYVPGNVRWATMTEQANNRDNNRLIEHEGKIWSLHELAEHCGIRYETLHYRLYTARWPIQKALSIKSGDRKTIAREITTPQLAGKSRMENASAVVEFMGRKVRITELARTFQMPRKILSHRILASKWSVEKAVSTPYRPRAGRNPAPLYGS